jgi:hypothetical protein
VVLEGRIVTAGAQKSVLLKTLRQHDDFRDSEDLGEQIESLKKKETGYIDEIAVRTEEQELAKARIEILERARQQ